MAADNFASMHYDFLLKFSSLIPSSRCVRLYPS